MRDKVTQSDIDAAKRYLQGSGPWKLDEIGIGADDYLVKCFARHRVAALQQRSAVEHKLGFWLSAALDEPNACDEFKTDIRNWFEQHRPEPDQLNIV